mmetsp:Transcript_823/g.868  ORF Transcript_823/g.868 Transcript_823/m.868 type:complete len:135 (-) Transcript_823:306-710(-)
MGMCAITFCFPPIAIMSSCGVSVFQGFIEGKEIAVVVISGLTFITGLVIAFKLFAKCSEITTDDESIWMAGPCWNENNMMYYSDGLTSAILIGISFPWLLFSLNAYYRTAKGNSEIETTTVSPDNDSNVDYQKA